MEKRTKKVGSRVSGYFWTGIPKWYGKWCGNRCPRCAPLPWAAQLQPAAIPWCRTQDHRELGKDPSMDTIPCTELQFAPALRKKVCCCLPFGDAFCVAFWRCTQPNRGFFSSVSYFGLFNPRISGP